MSSLHRVSSYTGHREEDKAKVLDRELRIQWVDTKMPMKNEEETASKQQDWCGCMVWKQKNGTIGL